MEPRAYIYSRYSSAKQAEGDSLRRQYDECFEFAGTLGVPIDATLTDEGLSGYTGLNRIKGALGSFLKRVERGEIGRGSYLLVDSMDRISREDETVVLNLLTGLSLSGIRLCNVSERHVLAEKPETTDWIRLLVHASRSHKESEEKGRKVREAHGRSKQLARSEGRVWHAAGPHWLEAVVEGAGKSRTIRFEPVAERVAIVRRIFDLREAGFGTTAIARRLTDDGVMPPKGKHGWHHSAVLEVLKNRAVLGEYQPRRCPKGHRGSRRPADGDPVPGYYGDGIITPEQFYRVAAIIAARSPKTRLPNRRQVSSLFSGIARCGECGARMGIHVAKGGRTPVLRCYDAARGLCSNRTRFAYPEVERAILSRVADFDLSRCPVESSEAEQALAVASGRLAELEHQVTNLLDKMERLGVEESLEARYQQRCSERDALRAQLPTLQQAANAAGHHIDAHSRRGEIEALFAAMAGQDDRDLFETRTRLSQAIRDVVTNIRFSPEATHTLVLGASERPSTVTVKAGFEVSVLDGFSTYSFRLTEGRAFELLLASPASAGLLQMAKYRKRFVGNDPAKMAKATRILQNIAGQR